MSDEAVLRGRDLWLDAGQDLLRIGGVRTIKVRSLADHLRLTTGSFYHHFSGMQDFLDQLAAHFAGELRAALTSAEPGDPRERLRRLSELGVRHRIRPLDMAMRDWAMTSAAAAASVQAHDALVLEFLERAFVDMGHPTDEARLRAHLLHAVNTARLASSWPDDPGMFDRIVGVLSA
jgi:AcrR family transcriptional regulator